MSNPVAARHGFTDADWADVMNVKQTMAAPRFVPLFAILEEEEEVLEAVIIAKPEPKPKPILAPKPKAAPKLPPLPRKKRSPFVSVYNPNPLSEVTVPPAASQPVQSSLPPPVLCKCGRARRPLSSPCCWICLSETKGKETHHARA